MAEITIGEQTLDVERVPAGTTTWYQLSIAFRDPNGALKTRNCALDVEDRTELTADAIEEAVTDWKRGRTDVESISEFTVLSVDIARRSEPEGATHSDPTVGVVARPPSQRLPFSTGDRIVYYVDGPDSSVYGYTTDAVVVDTPPIHRQHKPPIEGKVEIDTGSDTKLVPIDWIVGPASDSESESERQTERS